MPTSWVQPLLTGEFTALGVTRVLEAIRCVESWHPLLSGQLAAKCSAASAPSRRTRRLPSGPAAPTAWPRCTGTGSRSTIARATVCLPARASCSITNRRGAARSSSRRKITDAVARIKLGVQEKLQLGNLDAHRDWGFAGDYVEAMWLMLQQEHADDYVVATGKKHSVRQLASWPSNRWISIPRNTSRSIPRCSGPAEVNTLCGDASKARRILGWRPTVDFPGLVAMMVEADLRRVRAEIAQSEADQRLG